MSAKPELAEGEKLVRFCPLDDCGKEFAEPMPTNVKIECPACDRTFRVTTYSK